MRKRIEAFLNGQSGAVPADYVLALAAVLGAMIAIIVGMIV